MFSHFRLISHYLATSTLSFEIVLILYFYSLRIYRWLRRRNGIGLLLRYKASFSQALLGAFLCEDWLFLTGFGLSFQSILAWSSWLNFLLFNWRFGFFLFRCRRSCLRRNKLDICAWIIFLQRVCLDFWWFRFWFWFQRNWILHNSRKWEKNYF